MQFAFETLTAGIPAIVVADGVPWTLVAGATRPPAILAIQGDWSHSAAAVAQLASNAARAWLVGAEAHRARSGLLAHRLAVQLARTSGIRAVYETIVDRMPRAVHARIAALAVVDSSDGHLTVVATHGYPKELVEHLRIEPRSGVFGSVFNSGRPLLVKNVQMSGGRRRRPRYRTDSYIAIPLMGAREVLGVVCVTDRRDDEPFSWSDVQLLRALAAPAALALGRERALAQAETYALTAAIDPLSGAFNRRHFHVRLEEELQRSVRHSLSLGFLMIDIDDFKAVNDSFGHLAGDAIIRDVAEILRRSVRVFDVCARFGGEEFAIIMPGSIVESAAMVAERIRERIEAYRSEEPVLEILRITVSIGLAVSSPGMTAHDLIESADRALYLAKRAGKNRVTVAGQESPMDRRAQPAESRDTETTGSGH
jgi:diguanylate cyclase (GGDEF)-like protein